MVSFFPQVPHDENAHAIEYLFFFYFDTLLTATSQFPPISNGGVTSNLEM